MLISVIIPVYNGEKYINKVFTSILNQTYKKLEIIFFNDASSDNSLEILKNLERKYSDLVKVYSSNQNNGPGGAKNEGLKKANGEYVLFIDCDDFISENYIENLFNSAKSNNYPDIVLSNFTKVDENENIKYIRNYKNANRAFVQKISSVGKLIKKDYLLKFKLSLPYGKVLEDVLFQSSLLITSPSYSYTEEAGYFYVYNSNSISHTTLKSFKKGSLENGFNYLISLKNNNLINSIEKEKLNYLAFKYICWHLLKSGNKVGKTLMKIEYEKAFTFLKKEFPNYKKFKKSNLKNERLIIKIVILFILLLNKLHLDKLFFKIYSIINLEKLWPNL